MNSTKFPMRGLGPEPLRAYLKFDLNGAASPVASTFEGDLRGFVTSVTYSATGLYTIVFNSRFTPADRPKFVCAGISESAGARFDVMQIGGYVTATKTLTVQTLNSSLAGVAITAPVAAGDAAVIIECVLNDSSVR